MEMSRPTLVLITLCFTISLSSAAVPCKSKPCGVGRCKNTGNGDYTCVCPKNYYSGINSTGKLTCLQGSCVSNPCGVGKCTSSGSGNYTCTCPFSFFFGKNSTTGKLTCIEGPCKSKPCGVGKCTDFGGGKYNCTCPKKYTSRINPSTGKLTCLPGSCVPNPCGVGKCSESTNGDYSCTCPKSHFLGYNASKVKTCLSGPCSSKPCGVGNCKPLGANYSCVCPMKYYPGVKNNSNVSTCLPSPCLSGNLCGVGTCIPKYNSANYSCKCPKGYISRHWWKNKTCVQRFKFFGNLSDGLVDGKSGDRLGSFFSHLSASYSASPGGSPAWKFPPSISWASILPAVMDQGSSCKSCTAFSVATAISSAFYLSSPQRYSTVPSVSVQQFLDCGGATCDGGWLEDTLEYSARKYLSSGNSWRYMGVADSASCTSNKLAKGQFNILRYEQVRLQGNLGLILAVEQQPIIVAIEASSDAFLNYEEGFLSTAGCYTNGVDHTVLLVGYNLSSSPPYWLLRNSWGEDWGEGGFFRLPMDDSVEGPCGIKVLPAYYPIIRKTAYSDPCSLQSFGSISRTNSGRLNPCGGGLCTPTGFSSYFCTCTDPFVAANNSDGSQTCIPKSPCSFFPSNPCGVGTCLDSTASTPGKYSCLCPIGYSQGQNAEDGSSTCVYGAQTKGVVMYTVPRNYDVTCTLIYTLYGLSKSIFFNLNPNINCSTGLPLPAGTTLNVTNNLGTCAVPYAVNEGETCGSISSRFKKELRGQISGSGSPNPDLNCSSLQPGQLICLQRNSKASDNSICSQPYSPRKNETCQSMIAAYFKGDAFSFYALNPGIHCSFFTSSVGGVSLSPTQVCLKAQSLGTILRGCKTGRTYTVKAGDSCFRLIGLIYKSSALFKKLNGVVCRQSLLKIRRVLCAPKL